MDLAEIFRVMRRRWYVLLPGLLLTAGLVTGAYLRVPLTYQSQSTVVLLNSQKATVAFDGNPFLSTQTSLTGMADSLARNLNSDASVADLRAEGASGSTLAKIADNAQGPLMWLTATGTDKAAVLHTDRLLTAYAAKRLEQFQVQQSVAPKAMIRMATVVPPQIPVAKTKTRTEYLVLAALMGIVISLVATFWFEASRRPARAAAAGTAAGATAAGQAREEAAAGREPAREEAAAPPDTHVRPAPRWSAARTGEPGPDGGPGPGDRGAPDPADHANPADTSGTQAHRFV
ncbi:chain length determinant protein [Streptomyces sp. HPF1205]|uniref:chain length determinant protein n=1 Tax=Streptomyces sp. HPF1205 TaxID=2873262 RepID=UPI001CED0A5E|nr:chain length determinant protein [Streptomyces sp. HPF1205]